MANDDSFSLFFRRFSHQPKKKLSIFKYFIFKIVHDIKALRKYLLYTLHLFLCLLFWCSSLIWSTLMLILLITKIIIIQVQQCNQKNSFNSPKSISPITQTKPTSKCTQLWFLPTEWLPWRTTGKKSVRRLSKTWNYKSEWTRRRKLLILDSVRKHKIEQPFKKHMIS